jgi:hypothetical protein
MTKLIHTYSLQAFPTEKYLKEFQPVRGMRFSGRIDLDPKDQEVLRESSLSRHLDRRSWLGTRIVPDVVPVFRLIAEKMGYDLPSLLEGKGETGKPTDTWTVYADEGQTPMLIRWTIGDAQLMLSIFVGSENFCPELTVLLLADDKAKRLLGDIGDALGALEEEFVPQRQVDVAEGGLLTRYLSGGSFWCDFSIRCRIHADPEQPLSPERMADLIALRNSAQVIIEEGSGGVADRGGMMIRNTKSRAAAIFSAPHEHPSQEFLSILHSWSVYDMEREMEKAFGAHFARQREVKEGVVTDASDDDGTPTVDLELAERQAHLALIVHEFTEELRSENGPSRIFHAFANRQPTIGRGFKRCPANVLRGTGPDLKMKGGHVTHSSDLLELLVDALCTLPEQYPGKGRYRAKVKVGGFIEAPVIADGYRDSKPSQTQFTDITNPFYASHHGVPVRVDKSVAVWRRGCDKEALAADFFYAPETKDLHVANLYRVKVPKD